MFKDKINVIEEEMLSQFGKASVVQKNQTEKIQDATKCLTDNLEILSELNDKNTSDMNNLLEELSNLVGNEIDLNLDVSSTEDITIINDVSNTEIEKERLIDIEPLSITDGWDKYYSEVENLAELENINLSIDPFEVLLSESEKNRILKQVKDDYTMEKAKCDKYDYFLASFSGIISGFVDVFFVGSAISDSKGKLSEFTDQQAEKVIVKFSDFIIQNDKKNNTKIGMSFDKAESSLQNRVQYLEKRFKVPYDARYVKDLSNSKNLKMNTNNHHSVSLGHSPDLMGLLFSLLDQFTNKGTYYSNGSFVRSTLSSGKSYHMEGNNIIEKLFFGVTQWFGHCMSDLIGSNSSVGHGNRGTGLPIPFTQMFQGANNIHFKGDDISKIARETFENGYDVRHGSATTIPVILNELIVRFLWAIKQYYVHKKNMKEILFSKDSPELRRMVVTSYGCLCIVDGTDGLLRSKGNTVIFLSRINISAWSRFAYLGIKEARVMYGENIIDVDRLDKDLKSEWEQVYTISSKY